MALLISNRGNLEGPREKKENSIDYVTHALDQGYHVVVDTWIMGEQHLALGSQLPQYSTSLDFIKNQKIICRCKTPETLQYLLDEGVHCFMDTKGANPTLTSGGLIWNNPGQAVTSRGIFTMPEWIMEDPRTVSNLPCSGICSNFIKKISEGRC